MFYLGLPGEETLVARYALVGFFVGSISLLPVVGVRAFPPWRCVYPACLLPTTWPMPCLVA